MAKKPPITGTTHELPFEKLSPRDFERMCLWLVRREGYPTAEHHGAAGSDRGRDLVAQREEGLTAFQCKREKQFGPAKAEEAVQKILAEGPTPTEIILLVACDVSVDTRERAAEVAGEIPCAVWAWTELDEQVNRHLEVVEEFFELSGQRKRSEAPGLGSSRAGVYISSAGVDEACASMLRSDIERFLFRSGAEGPIFWEDPAGQGALPSTSDEIQFFLLVVTPEALADRHLTRVWADFRKMRSLGVRSRTLALIMSQCPPAPLLDFTQTIDFSAPEVLDYRNALSELAGMLLGDESALDPPPNLKGPFLQARRLPGDIYSQLVKWLEPLMSRQLVRRALAAALNLEHRKILDGYSTALLQASAAIVLSRGDEDPIRAALRLIEVVCEEVEPEENSVRLAELQGLNTKLLRLWDDSPPDSGLLAAWQKKVQGDHERLVDYFQQRQELDLLDRVYVELSMSAGEIQTDSDVPRAAGGKSSLLSLLRLDPMRHSWVTRRWVVRGDPGAGKTTMLRHLAAQLARERDSRLVPIFQSLSVLMRSGQFLLERLERSMRRTGHRGLAAVLDQEGEKGRLLLLLDGLDEVGAEVREEAEGVIRQLADRWPKSTIVVSTRPIGYRRFSSSFFELQLLPLDKDRQQEFLARWFGRADGEKDDARAAVSLRDLHAGGLGDLTGNPLYLTLMALLLEREISPSRHRTELYGQVFNLLLQGQHKHGRIQPIQRPRLVRRVLQRIAYGMTLDNLDSEPYTELEERLYHPKIQDLHHTLREVPRWDRNPRQFLQDLAEKVGILGPHDGEDCDWRFWHRTFREALTAEQLAEISKADGPEAILNLAKGLKGQESRWAEPFALLSGLVSQPDDLIHSLVRTNRSLGLRALATAQGVSDEALIGLLELGDEAHSRESIFTQIPEKVGDPKRAIHLINRLCKRFNQVTDLQALDRAAELVALRWRDSKDLAVDARLEIHKDILRNLQYWEQRAQIYKDIPSRFSGAADALRVLDALRKRTRNGNDLYFIYKAAACPRSERPGADASATQLRDRLYKHVPLKVDSELFRYFRTPEGDRPDLWKKITLKGFREEERQEHGYADSSGELEDAARHLWVAAVPVTNEQFAAFCPERPFHAWEGISAGELAYHPRVNVTWFEAVSFCRWLSSVVGLKGARLLKEEEWEHCCRAGTKTDYWNGDTISDLAKVGWYDQNSGRKTHRVGSKPSNPYGLFDMHGNVWEWTSSTFEVSSYRGGLTDDPDTSRRVIRGGSCWYGAHGATSKYRREGNPNWRIAVLGFRVALSAPPGKEESLSLGES